MDMKDLKKKTDTELRAMANELREKLRTFRFGEAGSRTRNVKEGKDTKRTIAQIMTELSMRVAQTDKTA
jgi:ribosomal protein L29